MSHLLPFLSMATLPSHGVNGANTHNLPRIQHDPDAIVVIMDLSGYTTTTRLLMEQAEKHDQLQNKALHASSINASQYVGKLIKYCLDPLVDLVLSHGGDVVKYGGDALFCLWQSNIASDAGPAQTSREQRIMSATLCCIKAAREIRLNPLLDFENKPIPLALHSVIHWGAVDIVHVGDGHLDRMESICYGPEYLFACSLLEKAGRDEIVLTVGTMRHIENALAELPFIAKKLKKENIWSLHVDCKAEYQNEIETVLSLANRRQNVMEYYAQIPNLLDQSVPFVDESVRARHRESSSFSPEIRQATVVFIRLTRRDNGDDSQRLSWHLNELFNAAQQACHPPGIPAPLGIIRQLAVDDKGLSILLLFGLQPSVSENPSLSAACVALKLLSTIIAHKLPFSAACGIATDRIFSGIISSSDKSRMEHAILGNAVNLSARLMMAPQAENTIICDKFTKEMLASASKLVRTNAILEPLKVKGWKEPLDVFVVQEGVSISKSSLQDYNQSNQTKFVEVDFHNSKDDEVWQHIIDALETRYNKNLEIKEDNRRSSMISTKQPSIHTFVIEGPSGAGKSMTARRICNYSRSKGYFIWEIQTFEIEQDTAFSCLRQLLNAIVNEFTKNDNCVALLQKSQTKLSDNSDIFDQIVATLDIPVRHASTIRNFQKYMLSKVTSVSAQGYSVPEANFHSKISPDSVLIAVTEAIIFLIDRLSKFVNILIVFDDTQWQDRYSWYITAAIHAQCRVIPLVIISRPSKEYRDQSICSLYESIKESNISYPIVVGKVTLQRTTEITNYLFGKEWHAEQVQQVSQCLFDLSRGNAFALDVLLRHIQKRIIHQKKINMDAGFNPLQVLPKDTRAIFASQLNNLDPTYQNIIRIAALIGQVFYLMDVIQLCRISQTETFDYWCIKVHEWDTFDFIEELDNGRWRFRHCLISYQIYSLLPVDERLALQREMATYFEQVINQPQGKFRKSELRPMLYQLYVSLNDDNKAFHSACKLVSMYHKLAMHTSCRKMLLVVMADRKRFAVTAMRDKLHMIGAHSGFYLSDNSLSSPCLRPFTEAYAGIKLKSCTLLLVFQFLHIVKKIDSLILKFKKSGEFPQQKSSNYLNTNVPIDRQILFIRIMTISNQTSGDIEHVFLTSTAQAYISYNLTLQGQFFSQWVEVWTSNCLIMHTYGRTESAHLLTEYLGLDTLAPESMLMKRLREYELMTLPQIEELLLPFPRFMSMLAPLYSVYSVHYGRGYALANRFWEIVCNSGNIYLMDSVMKLFIVILSKWTDRPMRQDYPIPVYVRTLRLQCENQPSYVPDSNVIVGALRLFAIGCFEVQYIFEEPDKYDSYLKRCPEIKVNDDDKKFVIDYISKSCSQLNETEQDQYLNTLLMNIAMTFKYLIQSDAENSIHYYQKSLLVFRKLKGFMRSIIYSLYSDTIAGHVVLFGYLTTNIFTVDQRKLLHRLLLEFFTTQVKISFSAKNQWALNKSLKFSYIQGCAVKRVLTCKSANDCQKCLPQLREALSIAQSIECYSGQKTWYELLFLMQAGVVPFETIPTQRLSLNSDTISECRSTFQKCIALHERSHTLWSMRQLEMVAKSIGIF